MASIVERPATFYPFQRLPFELRIMIWTEAFLRPQLVEVFARFYYHGLLPNQYTNPNSPAPKYSPGFDVTYPIFQTHGERLPTLFRINNETHMLASKSYEVCLNTTIDPRTRFSPLAQRWLEEQTGYNILHHNLERLLSRILPTSINQKRIKRKHAWFTAKGIFFQPTKDRIYLRRTAGEYWGAQACCMHNLPPSALHTENITSLAMDWQLGCAYNYVFLNLCVPHIFPFYGYSPRERNEHMLSYLKEFVIVIDKEKVHSYQLEPPLYAFVRPSGFVGSWPMIEAKPKVVEGYGRSGRLDVVTVYESDLPGVTARL